MVVYMPNLIFLIDTTKGMKNRKYVTIRRNIPEAAERLNHEKYDIQASVWPFTK